MLGFEHVLNELASVAALQEVDQVLGGSSIAIPRIDFLIRGINGRLDEDNILVKKSSLPHLGRVFFLLKIRLRDEALP